MPRLQQLTLTRFLGDTTKWPCTLQTCTRLTSIDLSCNRFSASLMTDLGAVLRHVTGLQELKLASNREFDAFLRFFTFNRDAERVPCLRVLDMRSPAGAEPQVRNECARAAWEAFTGLAGAGAAAITYEGWLRKWVHAPCDAA
jgi:hypothetical protein